MGEIIYKGLALTLVTAVGFGIAYWVILSDKRSRINQLLFLTIGFTLLYSVVDYSASFANNSVSTVLLRLTYALAIVAITTFYFFTRYFPVRSTKNILLEISVIILSFFMALMTLLTDVVVQNVGIQSWDRSVTPGNLISIYYGILLLTLIFSVYNLITKYIRSSKPDKLKIKMMLWGAFISVLLEIVFNIILPIFNINSLYYIGDYSIIIFFGLTAYAIIKHHLFDARRNPYDRRDVSGRICLTFPASMRRS